jgi:hypothetical protein
MKKSPLIWLLISFLGLMILGESSQIARAKMNIPHRGENLREAEQAAENTPIPTTLPVTEIEPTPEARVMPPVWSNAGLVLGASVLVLIIVGGVLGARQRKKH